MGATAAQINKIRQKSKPKKAKPKGPTAAGQLKAESQIFSNPDINNALLGYGAGEGSLADVLSKGDGKNSMALMEAAATGSGTGSRFAAEQIAQNPILAQLYGDQGLFSTIKGDAMQGALTRDDAGAYGQASDQIARMAAQQEGGLAQSLSSRGFGGAASGAAGAGFSGLAGNKFEQLARAQTQIADQRKQRQMQSQQMLMNMGQQYSQDLGDQYSRQQQGKLAREGKLESEATRAFDRKQANQAQSNWQKEFDAANAGPSFGDILGGVAGMGLGALTGGAGTAIGGSLGSKVGKGLFG